MSESTEPQIPRVEVGRFARLAEARDRGLVVSARELPHWIERDGQEWVLLVEEPAVEEVARELAAFESEQQRSLLPEGPPAIIGPTSKISLYIVAWLMSGFFLAQQMAPKEWEERGVADGGAILAGQWWRTVTALTLHGDGPHLVANLATGLLFAGFLLSRLGSGLTWLAILMSGALGNAINAWGYRGESHLSIGASTACFGALGILVGIECVARWRQPDTRNLWQLILPIGAGLSLLAYLGVGEEGKHIDFMAHFFGALAGTILGAIAEVGRVHERLSVRAQSLCALAALLLVGSAWLLALHA